MPTMLERKAPVGPRMDDGFLDDLVDQLGVSLQITETMHKDSEKSYLDVAGWFAADGSSVAEFDPVISPQGSRAQDTVVYPLGKSEFDIDLLCVLNCEPREPMAIYDLLLNRLREHDRYKPIIRPQNRCIRLVYQRGYHLDIVPAIPLPGRPAGDTTVLIPDKEKMSMKTSNPKRFERWLEQQCTIPEGTMVKASAHIDPVKAPAPHYLRPPLKVTVQLLKRWRDVAFEERMDIAPSSIVLTTLAGMLYLGQQHPTEAFTGTIDGICGMIVAGTARNVMNPSNEGECLSTLWKTNDKAYQAFKDEMVLLRVRWGRVLECRNLTDVARLLKELFSEKPVNQAVDKYAEKFHDAARGGHLFTERKSAALHIKPVAAASPAVAAIANPPHRFYGGQVRPELLHRN